MERQFKSLDIKEQAGTPGTFSGWASRYHERDSYGDVVMPGAYDRTVQEHGGEIVILADHDHTRSVGLGLMTLKPEGLWVDAKLSLDLTDGRDAYIRMRDLKKSGLSIGYSVPPGGERFRKDGTRELLAIELFEISTVQFAALGSARVQSVKDRDAAELKQSLETLVCTIRSMVAVEQSRTTPRSPRSPERIMADMESNIRKLTSLVS